MILPSEYVTTVENTNLPLNTAEVNHHLKECFPDITVELLIPSLIKAVEKFGEQFTRRVFLTKTFINYRTGWSWASNSWRFQYELRRSRLISITSVKYIDTDENEQTISVDDYLTSTSEEYSSLLFVDNFDFPSLSTQNPQPIRIEFTAGYGTTQDSIPSNIKAAMLNHLAKIWKDRGDCPTAGQGFEDWMSALLPPTAKLIYSMERIPDLIL